VQLLLVLLEYELDEIDTEHNIPFALILNLLLSNNVNGLSRQVLEHPPLVKANHSP
jgi:hypothetical protein